MLRQQPGQAELDLRREIHTLQMKRRRLWLKGIIDLVLEEQIERLKQDLDVHRQFRN